MCDDASGAAGDGGAMCDQEEEKTKTGTSSLHTPIHNHTERWALLRIALDRQYLQIHPLLQVLHGT